MKEFTIRSSAAGKLMTNPRAKKDLFSQTTLTYVHDWAKEQIYGITKDFSNKYTEKGIMQEDEAIDKAIEWLDIPFIIKNETHFADGYFTGTPDLVLPDAVYDIKCSWDAFTFPLFEKDLPDKDYMYQLQVYMHLTGKKTGKVVYVLLNTLEEINKWGLQYDYENIDKKYRIRTFDVAYDESIIKDLQQRVDNIREYLKTII